MKKLACILVLVGVCAVMAAPQAEIDAAIARGVKFLLAQQAADGSFSDPQMPALTALPLWALVKGGEGKSEAAKKAAQFKDAKVKGEVAFVIAGANPKFARTV